MGLFDKFKNLFTDEEYIEEEKEVEEEIKIKPPKLPQVMMDSIEKTEKSKEVLKEPVKEETVSDRTLIKTNTKFNFPVEFNDDDFKTTRSSRNIVTKVKEEENIKNLYSNNKVEEKPKKFKCTPIVSPVYGILDKNYTKEEVKSKDETKYDMKRPTKNLNFEMIRKKAFGDLSDEIKENMLCEDCELLKKSIAETKIEIMHSDNLLSEMTKEKKEEDDNYYDFGISYTSKEEVTELKPTKLAKEEKDDLNLLEDDFPNNEEVPENVENSYNDLEIVNYNSMDPVAEKIETREESNKKKQNKLDNLDLTDDLFNLIDSMYQEEEK